MPSLKEKLKSLPDTSGVYLFYNSTQELIYVGKATFLRNRVRSYFSGPKSLRPIEEMIHEVTDIKWVETDSALEAAIWEGKYIKDFRPKYNVLWRDDKSWNYLVLTKDTYPKLLTIREHELNQQARPNFKYIFGPYPGLNTKEALKILRRLFYLSTCEPHQKRPCLYYEMGQCLGVCVGQISSVDYRKKVIKPLIYFLTGEKKKLIKNLTGQMKKFSAGENFEEATRLRNQIKFLGKIQDVAIINRSFVEDKLGGADVASDNNFRIEGYDISNLGTSGKVGSMVVFDAQGPVKSGYRKFKIKSVVGQSDVGCLAEILERRLKHSEWPLPNIFLVDGGLPQLNRAAKILRAARVLAPIIGIAKGQDRKKNEFFVSIEKNNWFAKWLKQNKNLLIRVRDEAHRFAIVFNRKQRRVI